ncbi:MAG: RNA-binding protein [Chitinophagales bacterium]|nr:RNA-binding protein [Chitinophagales bacterium]
MNIYVSGLSYKLTNDDLRLLFEQHGEVSSAKIILDKFSGQSRGFGFVEMPENGQKAIDALDNTSVDGKTISVSLAKPQKERSSYNNNDSYRTKESW